MSIALPPTVGSRFCDPSTEHVAKPNATKIQPRTFDTVDPCPITGGLWE
jgi:hypothetical protein